MKFKLLIGSIVLVIGVAIMAVREFTGIADSSDDEIKNVKAVDISEEPTDPIIKVYDKEIGMWVSEMNAMLSAPLDDPRLKEANNDEGFEYYLKAQKVMDLYPKLMGDTDFEKEQSNLFLLSSYIRHEQFARTAHLDPNGQAKEDMALSDQWDPTNDNMRQALEYLKQLVNDLDVAVNHGGSGETFGVTHLLNGDKVSEMESFIGGGGSGWN